MSIDVYAVGILSALKYRRAGCFIHQGEPGEPGIHNSPDDWQSIVGGRQPAVVTDYIENTTIRGTAE